MTQIQQRERICSKQQKYFFLWATFKIWVHQGSERARWCLLRMDKLCATLTWSHLNRCPASSQLLPKSAHHGRGGPKKRTWSRGACTALQRRLCTLASGSPCSHLPVCMCQSSDTVIYFSICRLEFSTNLIFISPQKKKITLKSPTQSRGHWVGDSAWMMPS